MMLKFMDTSRLEELSALAAVGALDEPDRTELESEIERAEFVLNTVRRDRDAAAALALALPTVTAPARLKEKLLCRIAPSSKSEISPLVSSNGFTYVARDDGTGWQEIRVPGAEFKLLSTDPKKGYAVALGRLRPNTRYPAHDHTFGEDCLVLSGDLTINGQSLKAGDFHRAEAGTHHEENFSVNGCTILIVLSLEDLGAQMAV
jgi:anti-sigma factor ChrR (cupin superfamily)